MSGKVLGIAATDMRRMFRDRRALFFILMLPVFIILLIGLTFGGQGNRVRVGLVDAGSGPLGRELHRMLADAPALRISTYAGVSSLQAAVRRQEVVAGVVIPPDYDVALRSVRREDVLFLSGPTQFSLSVRSAVASVVDHQAAVAQAARFATAESGASFDAAYGVARTQATGAGVGVDVTTASGTAPLPQGFSYTAPSNLVLFMFITSLAAAGVLVQNRRLGITRRMLATPTSAAAVLVGQSLGRFATALFQGLFILVVGRLVFGVNWGDPPAAAALVVVFALVATGAAMLIGTFARTEEQAASLGPPIGIALGMLGGCMWPISIVPPFLRALGHLTPHAWAMDAFIELVGRSGHLRSVAPNLVALGLFAAVLVPLGAWRLRRAV